MHTTKGHPQDRAFALVAPSDGGRPVSQPAEISISNLLGASRRNRRARTSTCKGVGTGTVAAWKVDRISAAEQAAVRALLDTPPTAARAAGSTLDWDPIVRRFDADVRFRDRSSPYAAPPPPLPVSLGLPCDWDPPLNRWQTYARLADKYVFGGVELATQRKRPRLPIGASQTAPIAGDLGRDIGQTRLRNSYRHSPGHANDTLRRSLNVIPTAGEYRSGT